MDPSLAAQVDDPFDPAPMPIHADWLEEHGDEAGAAVLRGLVATGFASIHAMAIWAALEAEPEAWRRSANGTGYGEDSFQPEGNDGWGSGDGGGSRNGRGHGDRHGSGYGDRFTPMNSHTSQGGAGDGGADRR